MLDARDIQAYRENGFILVPDVLDAGEVARLRSATDEFIRAAANVTTHDDIYDLEDSHTPAAPRVRRIKTPHLHHPEFARVARHPTIVAILDQLIGPGVRFDIGKLNMKSAGYGAAVEWHQDWAFYPHTNDDLAAVGIMLDDCDLENGPLMVMPGSHRGPVYDHHADGRFCGAINLATAELDLSKAVPLTGRAGSITIHHVRAIHGSAPNRSGKQRRLLLNQYTAADAWPLLGVPNYEEFAGKLISGTETVEPRVEIVPIRMPMPPAEHQGSIYENQKARGSSFFEQLEARPSAAMM